MVEVIETGGAKYDEGRENEECSAEEEVLATGNVKGVEMGTGKVTGSVDGMITRAL